MPVGVKKIRGKFRIVNKATGRIEKTKSGKPRDGGGHSSAAKANRQARAINAGIKRR